MSSNHGTPYYEGIRLGRRNLPGVLSRSAQLSADNRWGVYIRPLGRGRHRVKLPYSDQEFVVKSSSPTASFTPGASVILGSNTGRPGEVLLGLPSIGRTGLSQNPGAFDSSVTPAPPGDILSIAGDDIICYFDSVLQGTEFVSVGQMTQLKDYGPKLKNQPCSFGPQYLADFGDGLSAWAWNSTRTSNGVDWDATETRGGYRWVCAAFDIAVNDIVSIVEIDKNSPNEWSMNKSGTIGADNVWRAASTEGSLVKWGQMQWARGRFSDDLTPTDDTLVVDGVIEHSGPELTGSNQSGVRTGWWGTNRFRGHIRATLTTALMDPGRVAAIDEVFEAYSNGVAQTLP